MKTASRTILPFALVLTIAALAVLVINNTRYKHMLDQLHAENAQLAAQLDQASTEPAGRPQMKETNHVHTDGPASAIELLSWDVQAMQKKGLNDPVADIITDLKRHRELIPYKGVLGGTMNFYDDSKIWILTKKWVLAYFEDGHVAGYLLLEYEIAQDGRIIWKTVASYIA